MSAQQLAAWLGIETGPGEGVLWRFEWHWPVPGWLTVLLGAAVCAAIIWCNVRGTPTISRSLRWVLASLRIGAFAVLAFMIAQAALAAFRTGLPTLVLLIDDSASMALHDEYRPDEASALRELLDREEIPDRLTIGREALCRDDARLLKLLADRYRLELCDVRGDVIAADDRIDAIVSALEQMQASTPESPLGRAIERILQRNRGTLPAAVVVFSDGNTTVGPGLDSAADKAGEKGVPLFLVPIGDTRPPKDVAVEQIIADRSVFVGDVLGFDVRLNASGFGDSVVRIVVEEKMANGATAPLVETEETVPSDECVMTVRLYHRPSEEGLHRYVVRVEPLPDERRTDNNAQETVVEVRNEKLRVLLVQADPSFEYRYLRNALMREPSIELECVLQNADVEYREVAAGMRGGVPLTPAEWNTFDAVILGDVDPNLLLPRNLQDIREYVAGDRGGTLICIAGPRFMPAAYRGTPVEDLLPIDAGRVSDPARDGGNEAGFRIVPTPLGERCGAFQISDDPRETLSLWKTLPELYWYVAAPRLKPGARVLAVHSQATDTGGTPLPMIVMQYVGRGKVLFHATDETWRWRRRIGDKYFTRYWVQMIRYLCRSRLGGTSDALLTIDRDRYRVGESVSILAEFPTGLPGASEDVVVTVENGEGTRRHLTARRASLSEDRFQVVLDDLPIGTYHAWLSAPVLPKMPPGVDFSIEPPDAESAAVQARVDVMRRAAERSGGKLGKVDSLDTLFAELPEGTQVPVEALPPISLWNRWPILLLALGLLTVEWALRKWAGLP
ncbi:hypothetical protein JCM19992_15250 [Thermostilla marina]